jgi:CspA family cold shock protein
LEGEERPLKDRQSIDDRERFVGFATHRLQLAMAESKMTYRKKQSWPADRIQRRLHADEAFMEIVRAQRVFLASRKQDDLPGRPEAKRENRMPAGTLKTWNADRGFGFIAVDGAGVDLFLHISDLRASGIDPDGIRIGDRLTFETVRARKGGMKASNVRMA